MLHGAECSLRPGTTTHSFAMFAIFVLDEHVVRGEPSAPWRRVQPPPRSLSGAVRGAGVVHWMYWWNGRVTGRIRGFE